MRYLVLSTMASFAALMIGTPGYGQTAAQSADAPAQGSDPSPNGEVSTTGIADIVVTAQKRSQSAQKTPAAVTALSSEILVSRGLVDLAAINNVVPGARFNQEGNSMQLFLRGVGSNLDIANIEPVVNFNVNGVFIPREGTSAPLFDLESIEILPGPQGTLYGRGALGGAVNANFKRPTHELSTDAILEVGNYNLVHGTVTQNIPISDVLAVRLGGDYIYHEGYMKSGAYSKDDFAGRIGLLYDPNPDLKIYLWGQGVTKNGSPANAVNKGLDPVTGQYDESAFLNKDPWNDLRTPAQIAQAQSVPGLGGLFFQPRKDDQTYTFLSTGGQIDLRLGDGLTLSYIPSYLYLKSSERHWNGVLESQTDAKYRQVTQELRLSSDGPNLQWLAGVYAFQQRNSGFIILAPDVANLFVTNVLYNRIQGIAGFGQATYAIASGLRLTVGGRYSITGKKANGISPGDPYQTPYFFDRTFRHFDVKAGFEYDIAPRVMGYFTYQTGYQAGTYNEFPATPTQDNLVKPADLDSFTGGIKSRFLDNRLQVNIEGFYYKYTNLVLQSFDLSKVYNEIFNAKRVEIYGGQLDVTLMPTSNDMMSVSVSYAHARNKDFVTPDGSNFNGLQPPYAADWTIVGNLSHDFSLRNGYIRAAADARYESRWWADYLHNRGTEQKPSVIVNGSITYYSEGGRWDLGIWAKNLTNEAKIAAAAANGFPGPASGFLIEPRTFGGRLGLHF